MLSLENLKARGFAAVYTVTISDYTEYQGYCGSDKMDAICRFDVSDVKFGNRTNPANNSWSNFTIQFQLDGEIPDQESELWLVVAGPHQPNRGGYFEPQAYPFKTREELFKRLNQTHSHLQNYHGSELAVSGRYNTGEGIVFYVVRVIMP